MALKCEKCGYDLFPTDEKCDRCGAIVNSEKNNNPLISSENKQKSKKGISPKAQEKLVSLILIIMAGLLVFGISISNKRTKERKEIERQISHELELENDKKEIQELYNKHFNNWEKEFEDLQTVYNRDYIKVNNCTPQVKQLINPLDKNNSTNKASLIVDINLDVTGDVDYDALNNIELIIKYMSPRDYSDEIHTTSDNKYYVYQNIVINGETVVDQKVQEAQANASLKEIDNKISNQYDQGPCAICGGKLTCSICGESGLYCEKASYGSGSSHFCNKHWGDVVEWHNK